MKNNIKKYRVAMGYTQEELGKIVGHQTKHGISHLERGTYQPTLQMAVRIAQALGVDLDALYDIPSGAKGKRLASALQELNKIGKKEKNARAKARIQRANKHSRKHKDTELGQSK